MDGKPFYELTEHELREHPVWVLAMDVISYGGSDDEYDDETSLVVPLPGDPAVVAQLFAHCICYVRTTFVAANGRHFVGLICSRDGDGIESTQPAIVIGDEGQIDFYLGSAGSNVPNMASIAASYVRLGLGPAQLFPMEYRPDVPIPGGSPGGVLHGFSYLPGNKSDDPLEFVV